MTTEPVTEALVRAEVKRLIAELTERDTAEITDTALFVDDLGVDSLMAIELRNWVDSNLKMTLPTMEIMRGPSIRQLARRLLEVLAGDSAAPSSERTE